MKNKIKKDRMNAMKNKEEVKKTILGVLLGELDQIGKDVSDEEVLKTIKKLIKSNMEVGSENTLKENDILEKYMPTILKKEELENIVDQQISENGYSKMKDMGKIMSYLSTNYTSRYDGKRASEIVKNRLN